MRLPPKVAVIAVAVLSATACSSGSKADPVTSPPVSTTSAPVTTTSPPSTTARPATTTTAAPASTTTLDPKAEVIAAYEAYHRAYFRLLAEPDLNDSGLTLTMTGRQRTRVHQQVEERLAGNFRLRFPASSVFRDSSSVETYDGATAVVLACTVDDSYRLDLATGTTSNDAITTTLTRASMVVEGGRWKVEYVVIDRQWDGVAGCAG